MHLYMNNFEHSFTHYKTLTQHMKELGKKAQAGKGSCEKHCYWHDWNVWSHDITLLFAVFLYIE